MNLISKDIEDATIALLRAALAGVAGARVTGAWQEANASAKGEESPDDAIIATVGVSAPEFESYGFSGCEITVGIAVVVRQELAPTGAALAAVMEPIAALLLDCQLCTDEMVHDRFTVQRFRADGFKCHTSDPPTFDTARRVWVVTHGFTLHGCVTNSISDNT